MQRQQLQGSLLAPHAAREQSLSLPAQRHRPGAGALLGQGGEQQQREKKQKQPLLRWWRPAAGVRVWQLRQRAGWKWMEGW